MSTLLKKFILSFLSFLVLFVAVAPNFEIALAQSPAPSVSNWYNQNIFDWYGKVYDSTNPTEIFGERYTAAQVQWVFYGTMSFILNMGLDAVTAGKGSAFAACVFKSTKDLNSCWALIPKISALPQQKQSSLLSLVFADRPLSGINYVKNLASNFTLVPTAHAQTTGFGFDSLASIRPMWTATRNISFSIFVIAAIVFSFMIMFRMKISPQAVITVQSAIPKLVIALVLVTFSYAIAGFLIDLMYVVFGLFSIILPQFLSGIKMSPPDVFKLISGSNFNGVQTGAVVIFGYLIAYIGSFALILTILISQASTFVGGIFGLVLSIILIIIGIIVCLINAFKIVWMIMKAFVSILFLTIFAPLHIALGLVVPSLGFGNWMKSMISNLAIFVGTGVVMFISFIFLTQAFAKTGIQTSAGQIQAALGPFSAFMSGSQASTAITTFNPYWPPFLGSSDSNVTAGFTLLMLSFVLFTLVPKMAEVIQGFMSGKPFNYGSAIGETLAPTKTGLRSGLQFGVQGYEYEQMKAFSENPNFKGQKYQGEWWANAMRTAGLIK